MVILLIALFEKINLLFIFVAISLQNYSIITIFANG